MKPHNPNRVPKDVYLSFVSSLFGNRMTLVAGVIVHVVAFVAVAAKADAPLYYLLALAFLLTFVGRMLTFRQFDKVDKTSLTRADIERWETVYVIGATSTAAILGIGSGYAIFILRDPFAELACIAVTMASMVLSCCPLRCDI